MREIILMTQLFYPPASESFRESLDEKRRKKKSFFFYREISFLLFGIVLEEKSDFLCNFILQKVGDIVFSAMGWRQHTMVVVVYLFIFADQKPT